MISTGGSGGHVIPAITIYDHLNKNFEVTLVTDNRWNKFILKKKYPFNIIDTPKITKNVLKYPIVFLNFIIVIFKSYSLLKKNKTRYLISTGGYMSSPLCIAALILKIDIFLFEPNYILGRSNRFFLKFAKKIICYSYNIKKFPKKHMEKIFLTEPIIRKEIYNINLSDKKKDKFNILVIGGSQGANFFDKEIKKLFFDLFGKGKINLLQQIFDKKKINEISNEYKKIKVSHNLFTYDDEIYKKFDNIDFAITRSGASTVAELAYLNIPFLAIPFPYAKDDHQYINANYFYEKGLCYLVRQEDFENKKIISLIDNLIINKNEVFKIKENMKKFSYQNTWNNVNEKLIDLINEN